MLGSKIPKEGLLSDDDKVEIELLAEGFSIEEVVMYLWGLTSAEIDPELLKEVTRAWVKGRAKLKLFTIAKLKEQMAKKDGLQACLEVLTRFNADFKISSSTERDEMEHSVLAEAAREKLRASFRANGVL
jgi:hypothetical protein